MLCLYLEILWHEVLTNILTTINNKQCPDPGFLMALKANEVLRGFFFLKLLHTKSTNILIYKWHSITNKNNFKCSFQITLAIQLNSVRVINVGTRFITLSEFRIFLKDHTQMGTLGLTQSYWLAKLICFYKLAYGRNAPESLAETEKRKWGNQGW